LQKLLATVFLCVFVTAFSAAQAGKVEIIGAATDSSVPELVRQNLEPKGYLFTTDSAKPTCELWLRKSVPAQAAKETEGVDYPEIAESTMVGLIHFADAASDFRGHTIPAGFYTLRYELMPNDGNHLGAAPNRDFLLLVPAASDPDPAATFKFNELMSLSAKTGGTKHPSPLSLIPPDKPGSGTIAKDDQDHWIFNGTWKLSSGKDFPFALIVKGIAQQ